MFFTWHHVTIFYEYHQCKSNSSTPVLFLHGWGCDHTFFDYYTNALKEQSSVITIDFPGHGQSEETAAPWSVQDFADQVIALLDELQIQTVHLFAHSFGGRVAIKLSSCYPERVGRLVITGGAGLLKRPTFKKKIRNRAYKLCQTGLNQAKRIPLLTKRINKLQTNLRNRNSSPDYLALSEMMKKTFVLVINEDLTKNLRNIQAPALLLWGDLDTETPLWMGKVMEENIPDAGLVELNGGSHFAFLEQKERCLAIVKNFWELEG